MNQFFFNNFSLRGKQKKRLIEKGHITNHKIQEKQQVNHLHQYKSLSAKLYPTRYMDEGFVKKKKQRNQMKQLVWIISYQLEWLIKENDAEWKSSIKRC